MPKGEEAGLRKPLTLLEREEGAAKRGESASPLKKRKTAVAFLLPPEKHARARQDMHGREEKREPEKCDPSGEGVRHQETDFSCGRGGGGCDEESAGRAMQ